MKRKLIKHGPSSYIVSLPLQWIKDNSLDKGDEVTVTTVGNSLKITIEELQKTSALSIDLTKTKNLSEWIIYSLYKKGIDEIRISYSDRGQFSDVLRALDTDAIGYEIVETTNSSCTIKAITKLTNEFDIVLRRLFLVTLSLAEEGLKAVKEKDFGALEQINILEKSNNKLATYCRRYINKHGSDTYEHIGPLYYIVEQIEKIGDEYRYLFEDLTNVSDNGETLNESYLQLYDRISEMFRHFYECFYKFELKKLQLLKSERDELLDILEQKFKTIEGNFDFHLYRHASVLVEKVYSLVDPYLVLAMKDQGKK